MTFPKVKVAPQKPVPKPPLGCLCVMDHVTSLGKVKVKGHSFPYRLHGELRSAQSIQTKSVLVNRNQKKTVSSPATGTKNRVMNIRKQSSDRGLVVLCRTSVFSISGLPLFSPKVSHTQAVCHCGISFHGSRRNISICVF